MRISVDPRDSGHRTFLAWGGFDARFRVLLDGQEVKHCTAADEEMGEVLAAVLTEDGKLQPLGDEIMTAWRRGRVEIIHPERA